MQNLRRKTAPGNLVLEPRDEKFKERPDAKCHKGSVTSRRDSTQLILLSVKGKKDKEFPTPKKQLQIKAYANIIQGGG